MVNILGVSAQDGEELAPFRAEDTLVVLVQDEHLGGSLVLYVTDLVSSLDTLGWEGLERGDWGLVNSGVYCITMG